MDGSLIPAPSWFEVENASYIWGCLLSHLRVWENAINDSIETVLIFEDDAVLAENFTTDLTAFLDHVPQDWDQLWIGGDHEPGTVPIRINDNLYRPEAVWRTHCYAVRGEFIKTLYRFISEFNTPGRYHVPGDFHIDRQMAILARRVQYRIFCPPRWLVGQLSDYSDVADKVRHSATAFYNDVNPIPREDFRES